MQIRTSPQTAYGSDLHFCETTRFPGYPPAIYDCIGGVGFYFRRSLRCTENIWAGKELHKLSEQRLEIFDGGGLGVAGRAGVRRG